MTLGAIIAEGSRSTVHAWGNDAVAKVPRPDTPDAWIEAEAQFNHVVHATGAPVPEFLGFEQHGRRRISLFRRVDGQSMWDVAAKDVGQAATLGSELADMQFRLASVPPPVELPAQAHRLRAKVRAAVATVGEEVAAAADLGVDGPTQLCHGDLHPGNVILSVDGPVVVDWFDAARGDPVADVARSSTLLADASLAVASQCRGGAVAAPLVAALTSAYAARARDRFELDDETSARWRAVMAVARIAEGVPAQSLLDVWRRWRRATGDTEPAPADAG
ncbi:aminoglycoside phosphotransferase family protein [soil metagenome]